VWTICSRIDTFAEQKSTDDAIVVTLTNIVEVRQAASDRETACYSVRLQGVVLWVSSSQDQLILQDDSGGMAVKMDLHNQAPVRPGEKVLIAGDCFIRLEGIASEPLVDNDGIHASVEKSETIYLSAGLHPISVEWFNGPADFELAVDCAGPGMSRRKIPDASLFRTQLDSTGRTNDFTQGLDYSSYEGDWEFLPDFARLSALKRGVTNNFTLQVRSRDTDVGLVFSGYFQAPQDGDYTFWLKSDDGGKLYIGNTLRLTKLGQMNFPKPRPIFAGRFATPELEWQWVQIEGIVTRVRKIYQGTGIELASGSERVQLKVMGGDYNSMKKLLLARVRVTGIYQIAFDIDGLAVPSLLIPDSSGVASIPNDATPWSGHPISHKINDASTALPWLTNAIQVKSLTRTEAQRGYPVRIQGVITARSGSDFVIQDSTWSVFCYWNGSDKDLPEIGDYWEIEGRSDVAFAPDVIVGRVSYLRPGVLPDPIRPTQDELVNGSLDTQYIEAQGIATEVQTNAMTLLTREGRMQFSGLELNDLNGLEGALVRILGVCVPDRDTNQMLSTPLSPLRLFNALVSVDEPAPSHPFDIPLRHVSDLLFFDAHADALRRVKVTGQVMTGQRGEFFLMDGGNGFRIESGEPIQLRQGDMVEVVGLPDIGGPSPVLREALVRVTGSADLPKARRLFENTEINSKLDASLVTIESLLLGVSMDHAEETLELQSGTRNYLARLVNTNDILPNILPGSLLELTGVYASHGGIRSARRGVESFDLLINSPADIRVLARPSWWTFRHTLTVIGGMIIVIVFALIWITQLRRQVEERSLQLASEVKAREQAEYQRALEAERTRIAQDLHDELGATLTEIRFLGAVKSRDSLVPEATRSQLKEVSEKSHLMISSLDEIVWAVNPANDSLPNLANYLCHVAEEFFRATEMRCRLDVDQMLPSVTLISEVRHNLYLVVREALNNVVKHSNATEAWLRIHWKDQAVHIIVEDNGCGFVNQDGKLPGNGLSNMSRRLQKIGGKFQCEARPGQGTNCRIYLPLTWTGL
jgi:signal transduction histidine kinase